MGQPAKARPEAASLATPQPRSTAKSAASSKRKYDESGEEAVPLTLSTLPPLLQAPSYAGKHSQLKVLFLAHKLKQAQLRIARGREAGGQSSALQLPDVKEQQQVVQFLSRWVETNRNSSPSS